MDNSASFIVFVGEISVVVFNQYQYQYQYHYYYNNNPPENDVAAAASRHRHAIFSFVVSVIVGLLQIMYQNKNSSPFQTHPTTMSTPIASLLMYCLASELKFWSTTVLVSPTMMFLGSLTVACLASICLPEEFLVVLYVLCFLLLAGYSCKTEQSQHTRCLS